MIDTSKKTKGILRNAHDDDQLLLYDPTIDSLRACLKKENISSNSPQHDTAATTKTRRSVTFGSLEILEFPIELGDHPGVRNGPPLQIGWKPQKVNKMEFELYELFRERRRARRELPISIDERIAILLSQGYTCDEMNEAAIECAKVKYERFLSTLDDEENATMTTMTNCRLHATMICEEDNQHLLQHSLA